jgi:hypothetical protein
MAVGHGITSCTSKLEAAPVDPGLLPVQEGRVVIVDTPGFDDSVHDDSEILRRIAEWLKDA